MIARVWFSSTIPSKAQEFEAYLGVTGVKDIAATPGNKGVLVLRRDSDERTEFGVISFWGSLDDVVAFAGPDPRRVRYYPQDREFLLELPPFATHYEVVAERKT